MWMHTSTLAWQAAAWAKRHPRPLGEHFKDLGPGLVGRHRNSFCLEYLPLLEVWVGAYVNNGTITGPSGLFFYPKANGSDELRAGGDFSGSLD